VATGADSLKNSTAHEVLRRVRELGYRYPQGFAGFRGSLDSWPTGVRTGETVEVRSPKEIRLDVNASETGIAWLRQDLGSIAGHRWHVPYEAADGRYPRTRENDDHPLRQLIRVHDDPFDSSYRVLDGQITHINRQMGTPRFSILIQERAAVEDGRALPARFTVVATGTRRRTG
jgi:hypothetical protein